MQRVGWAGGGGIDRRVERDRPAEGQGREGTQRLAWRTTIREPNGHRDASFDVRAGLFFFFLFSPPLFSLSLVFLPTTSGSTSVTDPFSWAMVVSGEFVNCCWNNLRKCTNMYNISKMFD